jgi:thioredoxin reductase (NADPH)
MKYEVMIVGSGPTGLAAAIYTARAQLKTLVLSGPQVGGQLMETMEVENYPGFWEVNRQKLTGPELIGRMKNQAEFFGVEIKMETVQAIGNRQPSQRRAGQATGFVVKTDGEEYQAGAVIVATGAKPRWLGLESEQRLRGKGVSACATCDGFFFRDKTVVVVGGGNTAVDEALFLSQLAKKVYLVHRRDKLRAEKVMQDRALKNERIEIIWNEEVVEVLGQEKVTGAKLKSGKELVVEGVFVAIGHEPAIGFLKGFLKLDQNGYIVIEDKMMTSVEGVFAAGDCVDYKYRQAVTAAGDGVKAAIEVINFLQV